MSEAKPKPKPANEWPDYLDETVLNVIQQDFKFAAMTPVQVKTKTFYNRIIKKKEKTSLNSFYAKFEECRYSDICKTTQRRGCGGDHGLGQNFSLCCAYFRDPTKT